MRKVGMIIIERAESDHDFMLPRDLSRGQVQSDKRGTAATAFEQRLVAILCTRLHDTACLRELVRFFRSGVDLAFDLGAGERIDLDRTTGTLSKNMKYACMSIFIAAIKCDTVRKNLCRSRLCPSAD